MNGVELINGRRSVRKFTQEKVSRELLEEVVALARYAPSWKNYQIARYTFVSDEAMKEQLANSAVLGHAYNAGTLRKAAGVLVLSYVKGQSGKIDLEKEAYATSKQNSWEVFDAGIACQTFCLAAHEKGLGTCIFGIFDEDQVPKIVDLPKEEAVAALIAYGFPEGERQAPPRKEVKELARFV